MKKMMYMFIYPLLLLLAHIFWPGVAEAAFLDRGPYLENFTAKTGVVRFRVDVSTPAWFTYGADPVCDKFQIFSPKTREHKINLFGLTPDTTHCYKIYLPADGTDGVYEAETGYFNSFPDKDKDEFSFIAFGESGAGSASQYRLAEIMNDLTPTLVVHTGGLVSTGKDKDADIQYFQPYSTITARVPFYPALSKSEYGPAFDKPAGKNFLKQNFTSYHSIPYTGQLPNFYFFDVAKARFFVLDTTAYAGVQSAPKLNRGSKQYAWLEKFLANANKKDATGKPEIIWKFVVMNAPLYSSGPHEPDPELLEALEPLFIRYGVDVVFQGTNRQYERTQLVKEGQPDDSGVIYITLGGGGRPLENKAHDYEWTESFSKKNHFAVVTVKDRTMSLNVYDENTEILDSFELQK